MAVTAVELLDVQNYGSSTTTVSFTSTIGRLLVLTIQRNNTNGATGVSTEHGTFVSVNNGSVNNRCLEMYALVTTSTTTDTLTVTYGQNSVNRLSITEFDGIDDTSLATAIVQNSTVNQYNGGGGPHDVAINLSAFGSATNATFLTSQALGTVTGEVGYTQMTALVELNNFFLASEDTTPTFTTTQKFRSTLGVAIEIGGVSSGELTIIPTGITSGEVFGDVVLQFDQIIESVGVESLESIPDPVIVTGSVFIQAVGIESSEFVSEPSLAFDQLITALGIESEEAFGFVIVKDGSVTVVTSGEILQMMIESLESPLIEKLHKQGLH